MATVRREPCSSCPYSKSTPAGLWHEDEYEKLRAYDRPTGEQPHGLFMCHKSDLGEPEQVCRGWTACHGRELLALRLALATGRLEPDDVDAEIQTKLYASGNEAADAGLAEVEDPGEAARAAIRRLAALQTQRVGSTTRQDDDEFWQDVRARAARIRAVCLDQIEPSVSGQ